MAKTQFKSKRGLRKKAYRKHKTGKKAHETDYNYAKLNCIGMPYNLYTWLRYSSSTGYFQVPMAVTPFPTQYWNSNVTAFAVGYNLQNPYNMKIQSGVQPQPVADSQYFGPNPSPSTPEQPTPINNTQVWSQLAWYANWYRKFRVIYATVTWTIRPITYLTGATAGLHSTNMPWSVTVLDSKYIPGINSPEILSDKDYDDVRATKGARTYVCSGNRTKPLIIKRKVNIAKFLGCKDINDVQFTNCTINPALNDTANMKNPSVMQQVFGYVRISRPSAPQIEAGLNPPKFAVQVDMTCKCHFSQLNRNNPWSLVGSTGPTGDYESPITSSSS